MTPTPIRTNREALSAAALSAAVVTLALADGKVQLAEHIEAFRVPGPLRLSGAFLNLWCGQERPTEALEAWLAARGLEIVAGLDHHGGFEVRKMGESGGLF